MATTTENKMTRPNESKVIPLEWLNTDILILTSKSQLKAYKKLNKIPNKILKTKDMLESNGFAGWIQIGLANYFYIYFRIKNIRTISHEVSHTVGHLFECFGLEGKQGGETYAYLTGYINNEICKLFKIKYPQNK